MTTISASTSQISPANERMYHQSNLLGDWKGKSTQHDQPVEFKVINIRGNQAQVEYTHNGRTERGFGTVDGATITFGNVTIGTKNGSAAALEFSTGTAKWAAVLSKQSSTADQNQLIGTWSGLSRQNGQVASVQVTSIDGRNAQVKFTLDGVLHQGTGIVSKNSIMFAGATFSSSDGSNGNVVFSVGHNTYSVPITKAKPSSTSSSVNKLA
jgi:hypothetical protein